MKLQIQASLPVEFREQMLKGALRAWGEIRRGHGP
jgi:hypothetical protein